MTRRADRGFTLLEIMIVIAIMGIMLAIAVPNYITYMKNQRLNGACRQLYGDLMNARLQAVGQNIYIIFQLTNGTSYRIVRDVNKNSVIDAAETGTTKTIHSDYPDVTLALKSGAVNPVFYPNGTSVNTSIDVTSSSLSKTKTVSVSTAGRVKIIN